MKASDVIKGQIVYAFERGLDDDFVLKRYRIMQAGQIFVGWVRLNKDGDPSSGLQKSSFRNSLPFEPTPEAAKQRLISFFEYEVGSYTSRLAEAEKLLAIAKGLTP